MSDQKPRKLIPPIPLTDPGFRYVPAFDTDIRKRFNGERWKMARAGIEPKRIRVPTLVVDVVLPIARVVR